MAISRRLRWVFPHSFRARLMTIVVVFTTMPVVLFACWLMWHNGVDPDRLLWVSALTASVTLLGATLALLIVYQLLAPLRQAADALDAYHHSQRVPRLPDHGEDDMGRLMRGINRCLRSIDADVRMLTRHALQDPLTGAMNRRGCEQALQASVANATRDGHPFVLFVVDLDNLKPINDERGHAAGDNALCQLVATAQKILRPGDWIGRWGGDEFLLGVFDEPEPARERVSHWLQLLASGRQDGHVGVLVSAGCAALGGEDAMALYNHADAAMYRAKFSGGHRMVCHDQTDCTEIIVGGSEATPAAA